MAHVTAEMIERGRAGPETGRAAERRRNAAQMRTARERLTSSGSGQRTFDVELLRAFVGAQGIALALQAALALASAAVLTLWVSPIGMAIWLGPVLAASGVLWQLARRFARADDTSTKYERWRRRFIVGVFVQNIAWAALVALFRDHADSTAQTCVLLSLLINAALTALLLSSVRESVYAALLPNTIGVLSLMLPVHVSSVPQTMLTCGVEVLCFVVAWRLHAISLANLAVQAERDASIVELEQARLNSDEARRRAEEANLAKSRFLATMSHELRTPLNAILGFSEVMKSELFGRHATPVYKEYSQDIHASGEHLLVLINEILDLSRVEAGRYDLREEPIQLAHIVEDCQHLLMLRANKRQITLCENIDRTLPRIWADERAIRQVVLNLLSNAIKFTPQGGNVTITLGRAPDGGQFVSIKDTGPGIPEAEIPIVMSSFGRGTLAQKNAEEGSGLGLPIVKGLVEMHGGTFTLKSKVRQGTEVIVMLPTERTIDALPRIDADGAAATGRH